MGLYNGTMNESPIYPRFVRPRLIEGLTDSPVVLIHGPRQSGKSTLARTLRVPDHTKRGRSNVIAVSNPIPISNPIIPLPTQTSDHGTSPLGSDPGAGYTYFSFDDDVLRAAAQSDPVGFVSDLPQRVILDEVQRVPELFTSIKLEVDRDRTPGRFVLTGSTNLLLIPRLSDSLAGRLQILRLHPFAQCELQVGRYSTDVRTDTVSDFLDALFGDGFGFGQSARLRDELPERIAAGGHPPAIALPQGRRRANWYRNYVETLVQRDVRDMSRIRRLDELPRLLAAAAAQTAGMFNRDSLARNLGITRPTVTDYLSLLERLFLLELLPPWSTNKLSRLVKTPKIHIGDTGLGSALLGVDAWGLAEDRQLLGQFAETFVYLELKKQASWHESYISLSHYRDKDRVEVDIVLERDGTSVAGVEVKSGATVTHSDFRGLRKLAKVTGDRFANGVVLYDGETTVSFGERLYAVPIRRLWEPQ